MTTTGGNKLTALIAQIKNALGNLVTLEIITAVGQVQFDDKGKNPDLDRGQAHKVILSKIDLLQGDIKTVFDPEFVTGNYQELRDFHKLREEQGHQLIKDNLAALKQLFDLAKDLRAEKDDE